MPSVKSLLSRVVQLEKRCRQPRSSLELAYGSFDSFSDEVQAEIAAGKLDAIEMPMVLAALRRWQSDRQL